VFFDQDKLDHSSNPLTTDHRIVALSVTLPKLSPFWCLDILEYHNPQSKRTSNLDTVSTWKSRAAFSERGWPEVPPTAGEIDPARQAAALLHPMW
jgi:hypothetical protein